MYPTIHKVQRSVMPIFRLYSNIYYTDYYTHTCTCINVHPVSLHSFTVEPYILVDTYMYSKREVESEKRAK